MKDINKVILVGRLGGDPVRYETKKGVAVVHFSLATSRKLRLPDGAPPETERPERTEWHRVVVWGKMGEHCAAYLKKGRAIYVEGMLRSNKYKDAAGVDKEFMEVHAEEISFLPKSEQRMEALTEAAALS